VFLDLSIIMSLYFGDLGLIFFDLLSDFGDFKILGLFGEMACCGDLDFILPDC
jgi:hypothetical protein